MRAAGPGQGWLGSIRVRILAVVVGLLVLSSIGSVLVLRTLLLQQLDAEIEERLDREAEEFALLSDGTDPQTGEPFDGDLRAILDVYFSREIPDEGESLLSFVDGRLYEASRSQDAAAVGELQPAIDYWMSLTEPERGSVDTVLGEARYVAVPLRGDGADGLFVVANFPSSEQAEINAAVQQHVLAQLGTLVVASLLGLALAGRVLRPLSALAATARRISDTDLSRRIPAAGRDEASQIAGAFNDMLARLEGAFTTQRRFLDDTSHELRTPLTVVRGHLELLELDGSADDRRETIALVVDELDRMAAEALERVREIAEVYTLTGRDPADAFIAAPWSAADGGPMPEGRHYALTHWYADPEAPGRGRTDEIGYTRYCATVDADLVRQWMADYPLRDAPEGYPVNM